ncbi:hypothetical protein TVAG_016230 [Trichomonas vaginalis G3]|uniref:Uncharacterized protein n=1 Tax=Trichomonas vaginalis (strain ATCC PRA-98 / G3) TaxID=412133 RepID=A2DP93_TRIV3|nr:hypothetical protein TVAGG3_0910390 [Trichomonas vaginalis G3]EAY17793.1 hypothetical protein TVAG_016230 [Trichomonas vaginalis G3]KAI5484384.1 hypothetical protein TVAGG3_0910390 [Trichomonas vaginalis G3]|eukprot:XP_001329928.1 hypothetical protein [Trichomonas vaginalis G3]
MSAPPSSLGESNTISEILIPDDFFKYQLESQTEIRHLIDDILAKSLFIARKHELMNEKSKYAAKTIAQELLLNATAAAFTLDTEITDIDADEDIELPKPDQWCSGVIPLITPDSINFRTTVLPERNNPHVNLPKPQKKEPAATPSQNQPKQTSQQSSPSRPQKLTKEMKTPTMSKQDATRSRSMLSQSYIKANITPATQILKAFEISKKQTQGSGRNFTVDQENNIIPIHDPKQLANVLIVPRIAAKRSKPEEVVAQPRKYKPPPPMTRISNKKKKAVSKLISPDQPIFDEDIPDYSLDKIAVNPGVTIKDGQNVRNIPKPEVEDKITKAQYDEYIKTLKASQDV